MEKCSTLDSDLKNRDRRVMIRIVIFVLLAIPGWCQGPEQHIPGDTLSAVSSFHPLLTTLPLNQHLRRYPHKPMFDFTTPRMPTIKRIRQKQAKQPKPRKDRYSLAACTTGMWFPIGRNQILGPHPSLGLVMGGWRGQWLIEFVMEFRMGPAAHDYKVLYKDSVVTSHNYFGAFIGMHVGYDIINFKNTSIYLLCGMGLDGFDAIDEDEEHDQSVSINALNMNSGIGLQHYGKKGGYWGIELLYNVIHYQNPRGTPLNGNGITIRLMFGAIVAH